MKSISLSCVFASLVSLIIMSGCKPRSASSTSSYPIENENYSEWFLTSGNWGTDSKIYVRTIGSGPDTVVMLHGGWGGEHHYLIEATKGLRDKYCFILY